MLALSTTDLLSPNIELLDLSRTPKHNRVHLRSMIWSVAILAATEPEVAVSTVDCLLVY